MKQHLQTILIAVGMLATVIMWAIRVETSVMAKADRGEVEKLQIRMDAAETLNELQREHLSEKVEELSSDVKEMKQLLIQALTRDSKKKEGAE